MLKKTLCTHPAKEKLRIAINWTTLTVFIIICLFTSSMTECFGAQKLSNRSLNRYGLYGTVLNGDPVPSYYGIQLAAHMPFDFMRLNLGGTYYNSIFVNLPIFLYNYTVAMLLRYTVGLFINKNFKVNTLSSQSSMAYSWGIKLFVPYFSISPVVGANVAGYQTSGNAYGLGSSRGQHMYYNVGIDFQSTTGKNLQIGYNLPSSKLSNKGGPYLNLGIFF